MFGAGWVALGVLVGCADAREPPNPRPDTGPVPEVPELLEPLAELPWEDLPLLPEAMEIENWKRAKFRWATATTAYARRDASAAAAHFLEAAGALYDPKLPRGPKQKIRRSARCLAYDNAAAALAAVGADARARMVLDRAAGRDPGCAASLDQRLQRVTPVETSSSPKTQRAKSSRAHSP